MSTALNWEKMENNLSDVGACFQFLLSCSATVVFVHWYCPWAQTPAAPCTMPGLGPLEIRWIPSTTTRSVGKDNIQRWAGAERWLCVSVFWPGAILIKHQSYAALHPPFWGIMWQSICSSQLTSSLYYLRLYFSQQPRYSKIMLSVTQRERSLHF